jgi:hypothetical protein
MTEIPWDDLSDKASAPNVFPAAFDSDCNACGGRIVEGDYICYNTDDEIVHEECYD